MCTLSAVRSVDGETLRVVMNRDERRLRPVAQPPIAVRAGAAEALWPVDPESGGTWIAANDAGLVFAVLNSSGAGVDADEPHAPRLRSTRSRGVVIPELAGARTLEEVDDRWRRLSRRDLAPFRLVAASLRGVWSWGHPPGPATAGHEQAGESVQPPLLFSSSALGDALVQQPRRALFEELLAADGDSFRAQDRLHQHAWPDRRHLSVLMTRVEACTVSCTEIRLQRHRIEMRYRPMVDGWPGPAVVRTLAIRATASSIAA